MPSSTLITSTTARPSSPTASLTPGLIADAIIEKLMLALTADPTRSVTSLAEQATRLRL